jgi:hypothetical protein
MKNMIFALLAFSVFVGCYTQEPIARQAPRNNKTYEVEYLFEHDGCKVYRFEDRGRDVYFTSCRGETVSMTDSTQIRNRTERKN